MKTIILLINFGLLSISSFSQTAAKENGKIFINHPYIDAVNKASEAYLKKDDATTMQIYSDTAKVWVSGMTKPISIQEAVKGWDADFDLYDSVKNKPYGYPDYLAYTKDNAKVVQSWWIWSGKSKKTGETLEVYYVLFDDFNKDGKITREGNYGDWSKLERK